MELCLCYLEEMESNRNFPQGNNFSQSKWELFQESFQKDI